MKYGKRISLLLVFFFAASIAVAQKSPASEVDLKKQAERFFEKQNYEEATPMYSQLLSLYPRDPIYNYRYGVCLLLSGRDKTGAATYLQVAAKEKETDPDVYFYLGRSYMFMEQYNEAISAFVLFKKNALASRHIILQPDLFIRNCENADQLRRDRKNVVVLNKRKVSRTAFFASYDFSEAAGKMLTTPDRFLTPLDKEKMPNPVMFMARDGETVYYASYGKKGDQGKDIYRINKSPDGSWGIPVNLGITINTNANEDFPYLDKDGRTLYFCSDGKSSIGGYDIFKSQYDFNTGKWNEPVNVGIPVNTVDDDIFFMPSTKGLTATYATAVDCEAGKIEIRNVKLGDVISDIAVIRGKYFSQDQVTRRDARISVIRTKDNGIVTSVKTDRTGEYELILPAGDEYMLVVEGGSYLPHAEVFSVPAGTSAIGLKQRISMNKARDKEEMTMTNYFSPSQVDPDLVSMEKPTQVAKSVFDVKDTANSKMQPITFEGKTLFVAPPSLRSMESLPNEPMAVRTETELSGQGKDGEINSPETINVENVDDPASGQDAERNIGTPDEPITEMEIRTPNDELAVTDKTSNAALVKMAFEDAATINEEAEVLRESAVEKAADARSLDSLSILQLKQANELLKAGNTEASEEKMMESKENSTEARILAREADSIQIVSAERKAEGEIAFSEASQLMKDFKVDTNSIAYQSGEKKEAGKDKSVKAALKKDESVLIEPSATVKTEKEVGGSHYEKAKVLSDEATRLSLAADEMMTKAVSSKDRSRKAYYQKKSDEFKKQSEIRKSESEKETALAVMANEKPLPAPETEPGSDIAQIKKTEATPETTSENALTENTTTAESVKKETIAIDKSSEEKTADAREKEKAESIAISEANNIAAVKTGEVPVSGNIPAENEADSKPSLTTQQAGKDNSGVNPEVPATTSKNVLIDSLGAGKAGEDLASNAEKTVQGNNTGEKTAMKSDPVQTEPSRESPSNIKEETAPKTILKDEVMGNDVAGGTKESKTEPVEKIAPDPIALRHFDNYRKHLAESKNTEVLSQETEAKLFAPESKQKRDSLEAKTAELNRRSVTEWQSAQQELALAKQIDPGIEEKAADKSIERNQVPPDRLNEKAVSARAEENKLTDNTSSEITNPEVVIAEKGQDEPVAVLDTTRPEYPKYVETQKVILEKQTETVNLFVEGMQLNKKVVAIKEDEMKLRDQAEVTTVKKDKNKLIEKADSLAMEADIISNRSKAMLSRAQKNTGAVKELTVKSDELKSKLIIIPAGQELAVNNPSQKAESAIPSEKETTPVNVQTNPVQEGGAEKLNNTGKTDPPAAQQEREVALDAGNVVSESLQKENTQDPEVKQIKTPVAPAQPPVYPAGNENNVQQKTADASKAKKESENNEPAQESAELLPVIEISDASTFSFGKGDAYSSANAIPIDPALPEGLVFKVQIGAFRKKLPDNTFKNLQPLSGETTRPGWIRYCLGLFRTFEPANLLKKEVRSMGYKDAFVVAYYNGKRIPLYDAYAMISKANAEVRKTYSAVSESEFSHLAKFEIKKSVTDTKPDDDAKAFYGTAERIPADNVEYAVQVGVYRSSRIPSVLNSLLPLNTEQMRSGLFRFTTGRFDNRASADSMKRIAVRSGVKDAFVVIYRGGIKAGASGILKIQPAAKETSVVSTSAPEVVEKTSERNNNIPDDLVFKVQIGAFRENVPMNTVSSFLAIADKGISRETDSRGLNIFYAGTYKNYSEVVAARAEIVAKGIKDAFIVAFVKGKRTAVTEAMKDLNRN